MVTRLEMTSSYISAEAKETASAAARREAEGRGGIAEDVERAGRETREYCS